MTALTTTGDVIDDGGVLVGASGLPTYEQVLGLRYQ